MAQYQPPQEQPSQPYQQPPPSQPFYQPPQQPYPQAPMQPPRKRRSPFLIGCGIAAGLVVLVILVVVIVAVASSGGKSAGTASSTTRTSSTTGNTPASSTSAIGKPVSDGTWTVTVNSVKSSHTDQFNILKPGQVFLVINVTLKNTDSSAQTASSLVMFALKDASGQTYDQDITHGNSPDGNVAPGGLLKGDIAYPVPTNVHSFTLQFTPSLDASQLVEWQIKD